MEPVERQVTLPADPDEVWALLTDPADLEGWLGEDVQLDPSPGARGRVREHDGTVRHLVVEEVDEGRQLSWTWWPDHDDRPDASSRVAITLTPTEGGTVVHVVEQPLTASASAARACAEAGWSHRLLHLEALLLLAAAVRG